MSSIDISPAAMTLFAVGIVAAIYVSTVYSLFVRRVARTRLRSLHTADRPADPSVPCTSASVIVYATGEADRLEALLPSILRQDYGGAFEVIVVNEGDSADVRSVINALQLKYRNLYLTFTPDGARSLSRKKLALTLGIKAARYPVVVLTTSDAVITSDQWLTKMMRHFGDPAIGIVLGYAAPEADTHLSRPQSYAFACDSTAWIAAAAGHHAYRGTELNIAYRRELFFANKGFSRSLNLHFGDDDIFISEISTRSNTAVELSPQSAVRFGSYDIASTIRGLALRHLFTDRFISHHPLPVLTIGEIGLWLAIVCPAVAAVIEPPGALPIALAAVIIAASMTTVALAWRKATAALLLRRLTLTAPWFSLSAPFRRLSLSARGHLSKQKRYTWD